MMMQKFVSALPNDILNVYKEEKEKGMLDNKPK
jgi:hypothetical protein